MKMCEPPHSPAKLATAPTLRALQSDDIVKFTDAVILEPPLASWAGQLSASREAGGGPDHIIQLRRSARKRLITCAEQYVLRLTAIATDSGMMSGRQPLLTGDPASSAVVMTGHQPVIFHPGLVFKYQTTEQFAAEHHAIPVAVVIDTDEGDPGAFSFPVQDPAVGSVTASALLPRLLTETASFSSSATLYSSSRLSSPEQIRQVRCRVAESLRSCGCDASARVFGQVADEYAAVKTPFTAEASLIVRWQHGIGARMPELPLSAICSFPEVLTLMAGILSRAAEFRTLHNELLGLFRSEHRMRNPANPFPDLGGTEDEIELPFWIVDHSTGVRSAAGCSRRGNQLQLLSKGQLMAQFELPVTEDAIASLLLSSRQLIPRGALITALLRTLFCDLFVHGTGGGNYDRFTDLLVTRWWGTAPAPFVVASATRCLFPEARQQIGRVQSVDRQLRDLMYHPQKHFGTGVFPEPLEQRLQLLMESKARAVEQMQQAHRDGQSARALGRQVQQVSDDVRALVSREYDGQLALLKDLRDEHIATLHNRTWPWFFFD